MRLKYYISLATIILMPLWISCNGKSNNSESKDGYLKVGEFQIRKGKSLNKKDWQCYEVQYDKICCPVEWKYINQKTFLFFSQLDDINENTFFVVVRYDMKINNLTLKDYLKEGYKQLKSDTVERFENYSLKELIFKDKTALYGEFETKIKDSLYITFSMYRELNGMIYDLSLKVPKEQKDKYYENFQDILYNYKANNKFIYSEKDELKSVHSITFDSL